MMTLWTRRIKQGKPPKVRKLVGITGVEEAAGRCAEMGQQYAMCVNGGAGSATVYEVTSGYALIGYIARQCAKTGATPFVPLYSSPEYFGMYQNILESAYAAEGQSEAFRTDFVRQVALSYSSSFNEMVVLAGILQREKIGCTAWFGDVASINSVLADIDGISIQGTGSTSNICIVGLLCDYSFLGEELIAAANYISPEPNALATLRGMDVFKLSAVVVALVMLPIWVLGKLPFK
jgi:hypothetical protein